MNKLREAVERARDQFRFYASEHRAKVSSARVIPLSPDEIGSTNAKAETNEDLALEMQRALDAEPFDVLALEKVQDYRFGTLIKGANYSFARGLTINPTHLPAALDAMLKDGFKLVCMFGDPQSDKMGFIFEHIGPDPRVQGLLEANNRLVEEKRALKRELARLQDDGK